MLKPLFAALFAISFAIPVAAQDPGFDCAKATTPQEKAICASPELSKADAEMTEVYRGLLTTVPPEVQAEIRENQRVWLHTRIAGCQPNASSAVFSVCLLNAETTRTAALKGMVATHNGITFVWRSIYVTAPDDADIAKIMRQIGGRDSGYVNASWPQAQSTAPEWTAWNKAIAEAAGPGIAQGGSKPRTHWSASDAVDQDTDVTVTLNSVSDTLVSASIAVMTYGHGAAHPNHGVTQLNWMLKEKRPLKGSDLFRSQVDWSNDLYNRINQYLHNALDANSGNYENFLNDSKGMQKTVRGIASEPSHWQIDSKGITIVFNPYEVACYACTPEPFTMPWDSLKPLLNPAFQIPR